MLLKDLGRRGQVHTGYLNVAAGVVQEGRMRRRLGNVCFAEKVL